MNWIDRITQAIKSDDIDHKRFERAACALLQPQYPGLSPIEGGTDLGRDADIYDLASPAEGPGGRLLATTGDPVKNVTNGLKRMREEGLTAEYLVIACSQPVSAKTRQKLEQRCADAGLRTPHIFGQDRMVQLLAKDPDWTEELFGFRGRISALISTPLASHDDETPLLGRDELVAQLRSAVEAGSDVLVVGVPGAGKSRVVRELTDATLLEPAGIAYLLDDLVLDKPRCVVVDDAHLHSDALMQLIALRRQEGLSFPVVAVAWPAEADAARTHLPDPVLIEVGLLRRDHMDEIVRAHGVTGVRARHLILEQADGRPGWAITLSQTLITGNGRHVASGAVLLDQVFRHVQSNADSAVTLDAVACLAALHSATIDDLGRISQLIGLPNATLIDSLRALATDGLLTFENGNWRLQPGLGGALVSRWFFGQPEMRSWDSLSHAFPDRHHDLTTSMLNAAKSSSSNGLRQRIGQWVRTLPSPQEWDESTLRLVHTYATTSEDAANYAARGANEILKHPRPLVTSPWGTTHDPLGDAAKKLLTRCVQQWFDADAVKGLLTLALADDRTRHNNTDHPMRVLGDRVCCTNW